MGVAKVEQALRHPAILDRWVVGLPTVYFALPDVQYGTKSDTPRVTLKLVCCLASKVKHHKFPSSEATAAQPGSQDADCLKGGSMQICTPRRRQHALGPPNLKLTAITAGTLHNSMTPSNILCQQCASSTKRADS